MNKTGQVWFRITIFLTLAGVSCGGFEGMTTANPPDGWELNGAVWGTDADENSSTVLSGGHSIEFIAGSAVDPVEFIASDFTPAAADSDYLVEATVRATSIAAGNTFTIGVGWYDSSKAWISDSNVHNAVLSAANVWEKIAGVVTAPSTGKYFKPFIQKTTRIRGRGISTI